MNGRSRLLPAVFWNTTLAVSRGRQLAVLFKLKFGLVCLLAQTVMEQEGHD